MITSYSGSSERARGRLRIGIVGYSKPGGSGVIASELGRLLAERGHEVHWIADAPPFRFAPFREKLVYHEASPLGCAPLRQPSYILGLATKLAEVVRGFHLDILHLHYAFPHAPAAILARGMLAEAVRPALVTTLHGTDVTDARHDPPFAEITRYSIRASDGVTAVSRFLQRTAHATFPENADIELIPNFVDLNAFSRALRRPGRFGFAYKDELLLMHLSNLRAVKAPVDTVRVLAAVNRERAARLVIIGDGPELPAIRAEATRLGMQDRVTFLGNQVAVPPLLACADAFLLPSSQESFGVAALEALACGVPVVATDAGGLPELIENGRSGYLTNAGDTAAMADRVLELTADAATLAKRREEARQRAIQFGAERIVPMYEAFYERILSR